MGALITALTAAGPSLIRAVGSLIGGTGQDVANKAADIVESADGSQDQIEKQLAQFSPDQIRALNDIQIKLAEIEKERDAAHIKASSEQIKQINQTMRTELDAQSAYRAGWRPTVGYTLSFCFAVMVGALAYSIVIDPDNIEHAVSGMMVIAPSMATVVGVRLSSERRERESNQTGQPSRGLLDLIDNRKR